MSSRVTRSSARRSAGSSNSHQEEQPPSHTTRPPPTSRKRKASHGEGSGESVNQPPTASSRIRSKRTKVETADAPAPPPTASRRRRPSQATSTMASSGPSSVPSENTSPQQPPSLSSSSRRRSGRKKDIQEPGSSSTPSHSSRRKKRASNSKADEDVIMKDDADEHKETTKSAAERDKQHMSDEDDEEDPSHPYDDQDDDDDEDDIFAGGYLGGRGMPHGMSSTLRALSGLVSGISLRLKNILDNLRQKNDPSVQLIALQELSELLLISTEDNLAGHFAPDQLVKELVTLMQPDEFEVEDRSEIMLLACRCLANLMEALPAATSTVVCGGAVPVLCQKLLEISYIDLAEQALSTLEKISVEFPASIVREGGLTACLAYLDFFATSTQRTAVTTAANCCRNIPEDCFSTIRDVMPTLLTVLSSNDQRVVEQGCLCVSRIVESFRTKDSKLEELVSAELLRAVLRLLLPGTTNMIGSHIHTMFLRVLSITARASPIRSVELFQMDVVDTLYQILTGVSPPSGTDDIAKKIDSVVIMQALIHRPREQVYETLNVICELLPNVQTEDLLFIDELDSMNREISSVALSTRSRKSPVAKRLELLEGCKDQLRRFAVILLPTLTDAYSSTVNLNVRQQVLTAQLKMLSNLDTDILEDALRPVPYASYLASILSQQDHPSLVTFALQAAELLLKRLESIYRYQFYREGVIAEIKSLANRPTKTSETKSKDKAENIAGHLSSSAAAASFIRDEDNGVAEADDSQDTARHSDEDDEDEDDVDDVDDQDDAHDDDSNSDSSSSSDNRYSDNAHLPNLEDLITLRAKRFLDAHETEGGQSIREQTSKILDDLKSLASRIESCYGKNSFEEGRGLFKRLAAYFDGDTREGITSYELMTSNVVDVLLTIFSGPTTPSNVDARAAFLEVFMNTSGKSQASPFSVLTSKLQDLLSRSEHFEVITVHHGAFDSNRSSPASMLAKQIRLKLIADEDSGIPRAFRNIMVSIHAIATFKALDDYLRPRISLSERPRGSRSAIAAYAAALSGARDADRRNAFLSPPTQSPADQTNRSGSRQTSQLKTPITPETTEASASAAGEEIAERRYSTRKRNPQAPVPPPPIAPEGASSGEPLECADETQLTDEDDLEDEDGALNAIVGDLEESMDAEEEEEAGDDPSAVNVEVTATGKVTARKEDGTRVATPIQTPRSARPSPAERLAAQMNALARASPSYPRSSAAPSRPTSYAAAIQAVSQDWHIEYSVNDQPLSNDTTIYRAVHFNPAQPNEAGPRPLWSAIHTIKFKKAPGPPPADGNTWFSAPDTKQELENGLPASLAKHPATAAILRLLSILHGFNANLEDVLSEGREQLTLKAEPVSQFVNTKLTAKLNRQLEEPLIVASNCLPSWSVDLARLYPFLFPFETRHLFLQSTSFGYSRSMSRWQNAQATNDSRHDRHDERPFLGRLLRQKVRIARSRILESALKVMELYGSSPSILEVEYFDEVGTGLGPTLEFYSTVSKEFAKKKLKLWRENESNDDNEFAFGKRGLFPAPMSEEQSGTENGKRVLHLFKMMGKFVARSMLDSRIIDISFNPTFFRVGDGDATVIPSLGAVKAVDSDLARSLKLLRKFAAAKKAVDENGRLSASEKVSETQKIEIEGARVEDLGLDFTLPGYPEIQLIPGGSAASVTIDNVANYVDKVVDLTLGSGVQKQVEAFRTGFSQVFPYAGIKAFTPDELVMLFGRVGEDWSLETLMDSIKADHGFNLDSKSVRNLLQVMSELSPEERRDFLQFITGSPKLPIGGFKRLTPMFTVVCKASEPPFTSDDYLPSVMTCVNYLKMPDYSSIEILKEKLFVAIKEGQGAFHLS